MVAERLRQQREEEERIRAAEEAERKRIEELERQEAEEERKKEEERERKRLKQKEKIERQKKEGTYSNVDREFAVTVTDRHCKLKKSRKIATFLFLIIKPKDDSFDGVK